MGQYFFILGKNPGLSMAEIISQIKGKIISFSDNFLIFQPQEEIDVNFWQDQLGGTIKIGKIISLANDFKPEIAVKMLTSFHRPHFGFSFYEKNDLLVNQVKKWAMEIKNQLKEKNISSRWVSSKDKILSSVIVLKNKLISDGAEFVFLKTSQKSYYGQTLSCQQFEDYSYRDFSRPAKNIEEGMLPPKLAKIMINLAKSSPEKTILDPFCGSGTILQEAALMGYKNIIGTDLSETAIKNSQKNLDWIFENSKIRTQNLKPKVKIQNCDAKNLSQKIAPNSIDTIITEPYLGPIKTKNIEYKIKNIIEELFDLYSAAFGEFKKILTSSGKIVIIFPVFRMGNELKFLPILDELKKSGWQVIPLLPEEYKGFLTPRQSIIYSRPDQIVLREIFIFKLDY